MKVLLALVVFGALMAQLCDCSDTSLEEERQLRSPVMLPLEVYLTPRYRDCLLGPDDYSLCVPAKKPAKCPTASWKKLVAIPEWKFMKKCA